MTSATLSYQSSVTMTQWWICIDCYSCHH